MKRTLQLTCICLFTLIIGTAAVSMAASFSADIATETNGKTETGKFYLTDQYYRWETTEDGKPVVIIADKKNNMHSILDVKEKFYFQIPSNDFRILMKDPFAASNYNETKYGSKVEGSEKISGFICKKQVLVLQGTKVQDRFYSDELKFPLKIISYQGKQIVVTELKNIKKTTFNDAFFKVPADFKKEEDPAAAAKREREARKKKEEALPGLTTVKKDNVPCNVKISTGGELTVPVDPAREVHLVIKNAANVESTYIVHEYYKGSSRKGFQAKPAKIEKNGFPKSMDFNDDFTRKTGMSLIDELRIKVEKGTICARITQRGADRIDNYNAGGMQTDTNVDPKRPFTLRITGDNPYGDQTSGFFNLSSTLLKTSEKVNFTMKKGQTLTWDFGADKGIDVVAVIIPAGKGGARITIVQPTVSAKPSAGAPSSQPVVKKIPQSKAQPKTVTEFSVKYPAGRGGPITPGKDLSVSVTGLSGNASGEIFFYNDRKNKKKIDQFKFKLNNNQSESFLLPGEKNAGWYTVWVHKGSFKVRLDQSPSAKNAPKPSAPKPSTPSDEKKEDVSSNTALEGKAPLMQGARVIKTIGRGAISRVDMEVPANPGEVVDFYKQAMSADGWQAATSLVRGPKGVLQMIKGKSMFTLRADGNGQKSIVSMVIQTR